MKIPCNPRLISMNSWQGVASINQPHHFGGVEKKTHAMCFRSRIKVRFVQHSGVRRPMCVRSTRCIYPAMPPPQSSFPLHHMYWCIVDASCVMTSNDPECVNPVSRTNTAIGRSENGLALGQNQSGSYFARDRRCKRTSDLENGTHD